MADKPAKKFCPHCGDRVRHSATRCPYCGQRIFTTGLVLTYIVVAVIIVAAIFLALVYKN